MSSLIRKITRKFKKVFKSKIIFPCAPENCVVALCCTKMCDKLEYDDNKLKDIVMTEQCCPDCGGKTLYEGPSGGLCTNIQCGTCNHEFNVCLPMIFERIGDGRPRGGYELR